MVGEGDMGVRWAPARSLLCVSHGQHCLDTWTLWSVILFNSHPSSTKAKGKVVCPDLVSYQTTSDVDEVASRVNSRIVSKGVSAMWESSGSSVTYV